MDDQVIWGWICLNLDLQELSEPGFAGECKRRNELRVYETLVGAV